MEHILHSHLGQHGAGVLAARAETKGAAVSGGIHIRGQHLEDLREVGLNSQIALKRRHKDTNVDFLKTK